MDTAIAARPAALPPYAAAERPLFTIQDPSNSQSELLRVVYEPEVEAEEVPLTYCNRGTQTDYRENSTQTCSLGQEKSRQPHTVAELRQPTETSFVKTRTMLRTVGEHQRAKAKFQSFLDEASTAEEFEARMLQVRQWESSAWAAREAALRDKDGQWLGDLQSAVLDREQQAEAKLEARLQARMQASRQQQEQHRSPSPPVRSQSQEATWGTRGGTTKAWQKSGRDGQLQQAAVTQAHATLQVLGEPEGGELEAKAALMAKNASSKLPQAALPHASLRKAREAEQLKQHLNRFTLTSIHHAKA